MELEESSGCPDPSTGRGTSIALDSGDEVVRLTP